MKLFEYFDKTYCINLKHREDRMLSFNNEVRKYDLGDYTRYDATLGSLIRKNIGSRLMDGEIGLIKTNIDILEESKKNNYNSILIIEDDCYFTDDVLNINELMKFVPDDWDMLYFGGNHNTHMGLNPPKQINEFVVKVYHTYTTHMVAIKSHLFETIISSISNYTNPIDVIYAQLQKRYNAYCFYPGFAKQQNGFSDIQNKVCEYTNIIK